MTFWEEVMSWGVILLVVVGVVLMLISLAEALPYMISDVRRICTKAHWTRGKRLADPGCDIFDLRHAGRKGKDA
jgi:hypothetical protein